jgi:hypothetical protein
VRDDGVEQIRGERFPLSDGQKPMNDGGGGGYPAGTNRSPVRVEFAITPLGETLVGCPIDGSFLGVVNGTV